MQSHFVPLLTFQYSCNRKIATSFGQAATLRAQPSTCRNFVFYRVQPSTSLVRGLQLLTSPEDAPLIDVRHIQLGLSSLAQQRFVAGGQPRTHAQSCRSPSTPSFKLRLRFCREASASIYSEGPHCWEKLCSRHSLPLGCFCNNVARSRYSGRHAGLQFSPSRSRQGICPQIAALSALTSPCSTLISVGSVRELPEATKVELCLLNTAAVFICGGASAVFAFVV